MESENAVAAGEEGSRTGRLPRWSRQEIVVLIQGKRVAESKVRHDKRSSKWSCVSSYCRMHGVNRGPIQCRKRWSNLSGDFKKIKDWESSHQSDSFWCMRNDLRRHNKLPGFFDKEVYDILDSPNEPDNEPLFDSRRAESVIFQDDKDEEDPKGKRKRKRVAEEEEEEEEEEDTNRRVLAVLERNSNALNSHLQAHNAHLEAQSQLSHSLLSILNNLVTTLNTISDKL